MGISTTERSRSWFIVSNNPEEHGFSGTPEEICQQYLDLWCKPSETRSAAAAYCVSANGLRHIHFVAEDKVDVRFSTVKNTFPSAHLEPTRGSKKQAMDYINKVGSFAEKGEQVLCTLFCGEIKGCQGHRSELDDIEDLIKEGKTPQEILETKFSYRRYEKMIKDAYYAKRLKDTPMKRDIEVVVHIGVAGSGKSYNMTKYELDTMYPYTDYTNGGLDMYNGQPVLFMDEFRGQVPYNQLLLMLDGYKIQLKSRYTNTWSLWNKVEITSVIPPEEWYNNENIRDTYDQLKRRISTVVFHWATDEKNIYLEEPQMYKGEKVYHSFELSIDQYTNYEDLKKKALASAGTLQGDGIDLFDVFDDENTYFA